VSASTPCGTACSTPSVGGGRCATSNPSEWFGPKEVRQLDRFAQFSIAAADLAVKDAGEH
jgi:3-oxoacyl-(acyl-carrier-protein) synthase